MKERRESRRRFLLASGRMLAVGGLASLVGVQEMKRRRLEGDPNCIKIWSCGECAKFEGCEWRNAGG